MEKEDFELKVHEMTSRIMRESLDSLFDWSRVVVRQAVLMTQVEMQLRALYPPGVKFTSKSPGVQELNAKYEDKTLVVNVLLALADSFTVYYDYDEHGGYEVDRFTFEFKPEQL